MPLLFSYGSLQQEAVQHRTLGHTLLGEADAVPDAEPALVVISDPVAAEVAGRTHHANLRLDQSPGNQVPGMVYEVSDADLALIDAYEAPSAYVRQEVTLVSGRQAWTYVHSTRTLRAATSDDIAAIAAIYNHYVAATVVTFETEAVATEDMARRMASVRALSLPWLVVESEGVVAGFAYACQWKTRAAYRYTVEATAYLAPGYAGRGLGRFIYARLLEEIRLRSARTVVGCIALPNRASVALHEHLGFKKVAHFEQVGFKQDRWVDVGYWQLMLTT